MADPSDPNNRSNPHIRLNSGTQDLLSDKRQSQRNNPFRDPVARPLGRPQGPPAGPPPVTGRAPPPYQQDASQASTDHLIPPPRQQRKPSRRYRDESPAASPTNSPSLSRRSSLDSTNSRSPFADSRPSSRGGSDDGDVNTQTVAEKFNILPAPGLLLFPEDVEKDDWLHNPEPADKERRDCNIFTRRGFVNVGGLALLIIGVLMLFVGYPLVTFLDKISHPQGVECARDPNCITSKAPLLKNLRTGLIDPDTPSSAMTRQATDGSTQHLVFSDEFNTDGRSFYDMDDPYFQAVDLWYGVTQDLEWYDPDAISTANGTLNIRFDAFQNHGLNYRSGMLQSWNKMCFQGGYLEASISLPGSGTVQGFWPGFWSMGNLGRPGYAATTDGMWPYTYWDKCDYGITANQSMSDGTSMLPGMRLPACICPENSGMTPSMGKSRSAPEIDALEAQITFLQPPTGEPIGGVSQSAQVAPFDVWYHPDYEYTAVYDPTVTSINPYAGGPFQQALSGVTILNNDWYNGNAFQKYAFENNPGDQGSTTWYVGSEKTWTLDARAIRPNGNVGQRLIPIEPMSVVANLGMSPGFSAINFPEIGKQLPATMRLDYIRIYQGPNDHLTCDPPGYETTSYIAQHPKAYLNREKLLWEDTGYAWPKNSFVHGCD